MHELSVVASLLDVARVEAARHGAARISRIHCRIGVLRQVDPWLLREAFETAKGDSPASSADLVVTSVGTTLTCRDCRGRTELDTWRFDCPACGSTHVFLAGGDEIELTSLELELPDDDRGIETKPPEEE